MDDLLKETFKKTQRYAEDIYLIQMSNGENRGRGYTNRTWDTNIELGLSKINLVEYLWTFHLTRYITDDDLVFEIQGNSKISGWFLNKTCAAIYSNGATLYQPNIRKDIIEEMPFDRDKPDNDKSRWEGAYFETRGHEELTNIPIRPNLDNKIIERMLEYSSRHENKTLEEIAKEEAAMPPSEYEWSNHATTYRTISCKEDGFILDVEQTGMHRTVYVSSKKSSTWSGDAFANLKVYPSEYINLTYWNTIWLAYAIRNHHVFKSLFRGDYASQLPHMQAMIRFLKEREDNFVHFLVNHYEGDLPNEWQVELSHWMSDKNYNNFSDFRARQFAKYLKIKEK